VHFFKQDQNTIHSRRYKNETNRIKVWRPRTWCVDSRQRRELGSGWSIWASRFNLQRNWKPRYKNNTNVD